MDRTINYNANIGHKRTSQRIIPAMKMVTRNKPESKIFRRAAVFSNFNAFWVYCSTGGLDLYHLFLVLATSVFFMRTNLTKNLCFNAFLFCFNVCMFAYRRRNSFSKTLLKQTQHVCLYSSAKGGGLDVREQLDSK